VKKWLELLPVAIFAAIALIVVAKLRFTLSHPGAELPRWRGAPVWKAPGAMLVLQEIIYKVKPDVIVETGTYRGGGTLFFASLLDLEDRGRVISIDITDWQPRPVHPRITYLIGSSIDPVILSKVRDSIPPGSVVVVDLDSNHAKSHVLEELRAYSPLVSPASYLIVEDATTGKQTWRPEMQRGPGEAVEEFLAENHDYVDDPSWATRLGDSYGNKYLRRIK